MKRSSFAAALLLAGALFTGSASAQTIASKLEHLGQSSYVQVAELMARQRNGFLTLQMALQNTDNEPRRVFWRVKWLDETGFQVWDDEAWKPLLLQGSARQNVQASAPTAQARDFRIQLNAEDNAMFPTGNASNDGAAGPTP